jgi:H+/gluconate symporter-like permease
MVIFLQASSVKPSSLETDILKKLPSFAEMVSYYGPFLALVLVLIIVIVFLQYRWFNKMLKAKDEEIARLVKRESDVSGRLVKMIDKEIKKKP